MSLVKSKKRNTAKGRARKFGPKFIENLIVENLPKLKVNPSSKEEDVSKYCGQPPERPDENFDKWLEAKYSFINHLISEKDKTYRCWACNDGHQILDTYCETCGGKSYLSEQLLHVRHKEEILSFENRMEQYKFLMETMTKFRKAFTPKERSVLVSLHKRQSDDIREGRFLPNPSQPSNLPPNKRKLFVDYYSKRGRYDCLSENPKAKIAFGLP